MILMSDWCTVVLPCHTPQEPITFAASRKPQLVRILVEALADAAKVARANRRAAHNNAGPSAPGAVAGGVAAMEGIEEDA